MTKNSIRAVYASPLTVVRLLLFFSLLACAGHLSAAIRYVRATPTGSGDGSNWDNASNNLQAMITASTIGDEVWVAKGTYQRANSGEYFSMKEGVKIYGGFEGDELSLDERDLANTSNASILKGNSYNVIKNDGNGLTNAAVLDGFTITGGVGDNNLGGGGIYNNNASPMLINCSITGNRAGDYGGGVSNRYSSPTLINCSITANTSDYGDGGGMFNRQSAPKLVNCSFTDNYAEYGGSAMYNSESASVLINCSILNNSTNDGGGAFKNIHSPSITLTNCSITGNIGGVMFNVNSSPTLTNCTICNNTNSNDNSAFYSAGSSSLKLRNTILYGNDVGIINRNDSSTEIHHSLIQGITSTDNSNISGDTDPLFVDPANSNYRLQPCSPVINKGSNTYYSSGQTPDLTAINTDLDGEPRFYASGTVDMGAYEYQAATATFAGVFYVKAGSTGTGTSWDCPLGDLQAAVNSAGSGQQVWVAKGTYQRANSGEYFRMKNNVKIFGGFKGDETSVDQRDLTNTAHASILQGKGTHVVYNNSGIEASALLDGFTITGGSGDFGGGIRNLSASPTIKNCIIANNAVNYHGAGMYNASSSPILINCKITGNRATSLGGGIYNATSAPSYTNCSFSDNRAVNGGGIFNTVNSAATLTNCTLTGNTASNGTGGISNNSSTLTVRNSIVYGNSSGINAGDISYSLVQDMTSTDNGNISGDADPLFVDAAMGNYRLQACSPVINKGSNSYYASGQNPDLSSITTDLEGEARFFNNGRVDMGAYELEYSTAIIYVKEGGTGPGTGWDCATGDLQGAINSAQSGNEVWVAGGIYQGSFSMKEGVKIYGGFKGDETSLSLRNLTIKAHASTLQGTDNYVVNNNRNGLTSEALLDGFTITGGLRNGIFNLVASPTIINCTIKSNSPENNGEYGGGIYNQESSPIITNCVITGNRSRFGGGGIANVNSSSPTITNCTISGNQAADNSGAIYNESSSSPVIRNCLVYGNTGGIRNYDSNPEIYYSLVQGITSTENGNISGDLDPAFVDAANSIYRLQACSPVIDKGNNDYYREIRGQFPDLSNVKTDLDGEVRIYGNATVDMGAYEFQGVRSTATTIYVDASVATPGNGDSWSGAIPSLAEAIRIAHTCSAVDKILVAEGTYYPEYKAGNGPGERHKAFTITRKGLELLGGYPAGGNGTRNPETHPTIMSGDLGTPGDNSDNAYHVLLTVGGDLDESLQVDGFTVRDGNADGGNGDFISVNGFNFISNARCGGWYNVYGSPRLNGMRITNNRSNNIGGGVLNEGGNPIVTNTLISENSANQGGGWYNFYGNPSMKNIVIRGNHSSLDGGGWYNGGGDPSVENSLFTGNSTGLTSAVWFGRNGNSSLVNCTVAGNTGNAIMHCYQGKINFRNSIIQDPNDRDLSYNLRDISFAHSIVKGSGGSANWNNAIGTNSGENLDIDPLFVDAANGNYRLQACSPVINRGSNSHYSYGRDRDPNLFNTATDLDGNARFYNKGTVDMGAYEFSGQPSELAADRDEVSAMIERDIFLRANGSDCKLIAYLTPKGASAVSGEVKAKVWLEATQPGNFVKRHYQITTTNGAESATAKVTLYFTQQEFTDFNAANSTKLPINAADTENYKTNLRIEKRSGKSDDDSGLPGSYHGGAETINPLDPAVNGSIIWNAWASRWEVSFDVTGFSGFFVKTINSPLPLKLLSFTGTKQEGANLLNWKTASEVNTLNFEVQSSTDAKNFTKIGTVNASGSGNHQYSYQDATLYHGNVYYRLKMNDRDGSFAYSKIISLAHGEVSPAMVYPNPAKESITLTVSPTLFLSTATLYDVTGRLLQSVIITANTQQVSIKSLRSGVYILKFADGTAQRFVKE